MFSTFRNTALAAIIAGLGLLFGASTPARADLMLVFQDTGPDIVGQPDVVDFLAEGNTAGEHITNSAGGSIGITPSSFVFDSIVFGPNTFSANLTTDPALFVITFTPTAPGTYQLTEGNGLSVTTNLATYNFPGPIGPFDVTVPSVAPVPEPASLALLAVGLAGLGMVLRTRRA